MKIDKEIIEALKLEETMSLEEASNSKLVQNLTDNSSFAIVSACRDELDASSNEERTYELKKEAKKWGFNEFIGRWVEQSKEGVPHNSDEKSLLIKNISLKDACRLGKKYEQSSIIYKDADKIEEICTTPFTDWQGNKHQPGDVVNTFHVDPEHPLNNKIASEIFSGRKEGPASKLVKGGNKKEFQLQEKYFLNAWSGFTYIPINLSD